MEESVGSYRWNLQYMALSLSYGILIKVITNEKGHVANPSRRMRTCEHLTTLQWSKYSGQVLHNMFGYATLFSTFIYVSILSTFMKTVSLRISYFFVDGLLKFVKLSYFISCVDIIYVNLKNFVRVRPLVKRSSSGHTGNTAQPTFGMG